MVTSIPAAGWRNNNNGSVNNVGSEGKYWSMSPNNESNGYNLNFNSSNVNPANNNNRATGRSVRCVQAFTNANEKSMSSLSFQEKLRNDVFHAYEDARKNKRNTLAQLEFEKNAEHNLVQLYHELLDSSYVPGKSICFLSHSPVLREVFASQFRDRVVHHLLFNYIAPIFEKYFIYDSYSCRKNKGTMFGIKRLDHHIRSCTNNYTRMAYVLKLDVQGYFMSIQKQRLYDIVLQGLKKYWEKN
mgnify:CR=1 FL=1